MTFNRALPDTFDPRKWNLVFAWKPTRVSPTQLVWLEPYWRKLMIVDEGSWADGYKYRWHIRPQGQNHEWLSPVIEA